MNEGTIFKLDKKYTPFLFKAIEAAKKSEFVTKYKYDIDHFYIFFNNYIKIITLAIIFIATKIF
ncbi:hypothetical protein [Gilliamella sp. Bif1-4]|jgi:hypothetical protein|uniref:hypothetical protein n=1 Tax=Gilliamella sp. Bif1-4 TaxID=3120233 RepID=UPI00080E09F1|nr:hypothetical protein [Gilliamella apicola]OCG42359.1 hypothetical protein A9G25_02870 [Gilliamella apicola]